MMNKTTRSQQFSIKDGATGRRNINEKDYTTENRVEAKLEAAAKIQTHLRSTTDKPLLESLI